MVRRKIQIRETLTRLFGLGAGLMLVTLGLIGRKNTTGEQLVLWKRAIVIAMGTFCLYCGAMYYFPKHRKMRAALDQELDQLERESDDAERDSK
jgi:hypothetical protein